MQSGPNKRPRKTLDTKSSPGSTLPLDQVALYPAWWTNSMTLNPNQALYNPLFYTAACALQMGGFQGPGLTNPPLVGGCGNQIQNWGFPSMPAAEHKLETPYDQTNPSLGTPLTVYNGCRATMVDRLNYYIDKPGSVSDEEVRRLWQGLVSNDTVWYLVEFE